MAGQRRGGIIQVSANGVSFDAKGEFTANIGRPKRESVIGSDGVHGFKETPQVSFIEGKITDRQGLDLAALVTMENATVTLQEANGKTIILRDAWYAGDGNVSTDEGEIDFRFESKSGEES